MLKPRVTSQPEFTLFYSMMFSRVCLKIYTSCYIIQVLLLLGKKRRAFKKTYEFVIV